MCKLYKLLTTEYLRRENPTDTISLFLHPPVPSEYVTCTMQRECALQSFSPNQFKLTFWLDVQTDKQILSKSQNSLSLNLTEV